MALAAVTREQQLRSPICRSRCPSCSSSPASDSTSDWRGSSGGRSSIRVARCACATGRWQRWGGRWRRCRCCFRIHRLSAAAGSAAAKPGAALRVGRISRLSPCLRRPRSSRRAVCRNLRLQVENSRLDFKVKVLLAMCTISEGDYQALCQVRLLARPLALAAGTRTTRVPHVPRALFLVGLFDCLASHRRPALTLARCAAQPATLPRSTRRSSCADRLQCEASARCVAVRVVSECTCMSSNVEIRARGACPSTSCPSASFWRRRRPRWELHRRPLLLLRQRPQHQRRRCWQLLTRPHRRRRHRRRRSSSI